MQPPGADEPVWVRRDVVESLHGMLLSAHGGAPGLRSEDLLESALGRPQHLFAYTEPSLFELAAAYVFGIARNHPFVDANKRTAFMTGYVFLRRNGREVSIPEAEVVVMMQRVASGDIPEDALAQWFRDHSEPL